MVVCGILDKSVYFVSFGIKLCELVVQYEFYDYGIQHIFIFSLYPSILPQTPILACP